MAGHSKWSKVKQFKGVVDVKRGKIFPKLSREITMAAKIGGGDPDLNPRLRMVRFRCRTASMPKENIERAIKKGQGDDSGASFEDLTYEIYAPGGVTLVVELSTNDRNRTAAEIRSLVAKAGGSLATSGAVSRLFQRRGQIIVLREATNEDQLMELALEAGAEDFKTEAEGYQILTEPGKFEALHRQIEARGIKCDSAEVTALPLATAPVTGAGGEAARELIEVFSNAEFAE